MFELLEMSNYKYRYSREELNMQVITPAAYQQSKNSYQFTRRWMWSVLYRLIDSKHSNSHSVRVRGYVSKKCGKFGKFS